MFALDETTRWILGRPNFWCGRYAVRLRLMGQVIPEDAQEEQAAVIYWMLCLYEEHGDKWQDVADAKLKATFTDGEQTKGDRMTRDELKAKHGTPEEFERAIWAAHAQLFVTTAEVEAAIHKYRDEWAVAEPGEQRREHQQDD